MNVSALETLGFFPEIRPNICSRIMLFMLSHDGHVMVRRSGEGREGAPSRIKFLSPWPFSHLLAGGALARENRSPRFYNFRSSCLQLKCLYIYRMGLSMAAVEPGSKESLENSLHVEQGGDKEHFSFKESHKSN